MERPNRFIAQAEPEDKTLLPAGEKSVRAHVKNTGRCAELLVPGARVYLERVGQEGDTALRKTEFDLIAVEKAGRIINMDSQCPNRVVEEWLRGGGLYEDVVSVRPEYTYGSSRFDFLLERKEKKVLIEVKGVTLERDSILLFPDAPSERAVRHLEELRRAVLAGYEACLIFLIQMKGADCFIPNAGMHPLFSDALHRAVEAGVRVLAYDCEVTADEITMGEPVPVQPGISKPLLLWYNANKRRLPWREAPEPYRVWVSEIMLQQTRVEAVKPYYAGFMETFPNIAALAAAPEEKLLKLWEGLGYYSRARNLHRAALMIMEKYGGRMPETFTELCKLPGIGSYTAGAIASIAFGQAVPAVDGNVLRVLARLQMYAGSVKEPAVKRRAEKILQELIPPDAPGDFNQALMELGACICIPSGQPRCDECPLAGVCLAHKEGRETEFPPRVSGKARRVEKLTVLIVRDAQNVAIRKRDAKGLLGGMYEFPSLQGHRTAEEVERYLKDKGISPLRILPLSPSRHIFTHREWDMWGYAVRADELRPDEPEADELGPVEPEADGQGGNKPGSGEEALDWLFVEPELAGERYPIPSAFGAYTSYLDILQGNGRFKAEQTEGGTD